MGRGSDGGDGRSTPSVGCTTEPNALRPMSTTTEDRSAAMPLVLRLLGGALALAGFAAWVRLVWVALADLDEVSPEGGAGTSLVTWGLTGTVLMISGMIVLHFALQDE